MILSLLVVFAVYYTCYIYNSASVALLYSRRTEAKGIANTQQPVPVIFNPARLNIAT